MVKNRKMKGIRIATTATGPRGGYACRVLVDYDNGETEDEGAINFASFEEMMKFVSELQLLTPSALRLRDNGAYVPQ